MSGGGSKRVVLRNAADERRWQCTLVECAIKPFPTMRTHLGIMGHSVWFSAIPRNIWDMHLPAK